MHKCLRQPDLLLIPSRVLPEGPVQIQFQTICVIVAFTLLISMIFSIYPALRAARTDPIEAIRDE